MLKRKPKRYRYPLELISPSSEPDIQNYRIWLPIDQCPYTYSVFLEHRCSFTHFRESQPLHHSIEFIPPHWPTPASAIEPSVDCSHTLCPERINHMSVIRYVVMASYNDVYEIIKELN